MALRSKTSNARNCAQFRKFGVCWRQQFTEASKNRKKRLLKQGRRVPARHWLGPLSNARWLGQWLTSKSTDTLPQDSFWLWLSVAMDRYNKGSKSFAVRPDQKHSVLHHTTYPISEKSEDFWIPVKTAPYEAHSEVQSVLHRGKVLGLQLYISKARVSSSWTHQWQNLCFFNALLH